MKKAEPSKYQDTLNLPQTTFPMRANLPVREKDLLEKWQTEKIIEQVLQKNAKHPKFTLHDGPPYANGPIHFGHILNKVLKDIIIKYKNLSGFQAQLIPGWDCHGLPIEHQVEKDLGPLSIRQACRAYAEKFVNVQKSQFQRLGIFAVWEQAYRTMDPAYEATIARELARLVRQDMIEQGTQPVSWCPHCQTALAEAEVEYQDHRSPSIFVKFRAGQDIQKASPTLAGKKVSLIIWTTTPWTLPANVALALHPRYTYVAIEVEGEVYIVAEGRLDPLRNLLNFQEDRLLDRIPAKQFEGLQAKHPFFDRTVSIVLGDHVNLETGTGIVHIAPGHGREDYELSRRYQLPVLSPVDEAGCFTQAVGVPEYVGQPVLEANQAIIEKLKQQKALIKAEELSHRHPHCWRCHHPILFRATPQYFLSLTQGDLRGKALDAIRRIEWIPPGARHRLYSMIETRLDWCISRQRHWGVPLMSFRCSSCHRSILNADWMEHLAQLFEKSSSDIFFQTEVKDLLPPNSTCPHCGSEKLLKENDILDVWFDSGVSFAEVLEKMHTFPADLYLEGSDQHRGWFQSALLLAMATRNQAPYQRVLTHGFVVDVSGKKYSKSAQNYQAPEILIQEVGAEILRLWVASEDYRRDIHFSSEILERLKESYRKIRNTFRFMLGNLDDFNPNTDSVPVKDRPELDQWMAGYLQEIFHVLKQAYEEYEFHKVYHTLNQTCTGTLSAFYLDILKHRLYTTPASSLERRAAQTTLYEIVTGLLPWMGPIFSFTAEEILAHLPQGQTLPESVHLMELPQVNLKMVSKALMERFEKIMEIRHGVFKAVEEAKNKKLLQHPREAQVLLCAEETLQKFLQDHTLLWPTYLGVSQVVIVYELENPTWQGENGLSIKVQKAEGELCERCWIYSTTVGKNKKHPSLCERCIKVLEEIA